MALEKEFGTPEEPPKKRSAAASGAASPTSARGGDARLGGKRALRAVAGAGEISPDAPPADPTNMDPTASAVARLRADARLDVKDAPNAATATFLFLAADILAACVAVSLFTLGLGLVGAPMLDFGAAAALSGVILAAFAAAGLYDQQSWELGEERRALAAALVVFVAAALAPFGDGADAGVGWRLAIAVAAGSACALLSLLGRMSLRAAPLLRRALRRPTVLVGAGLDPAKLANEQRESRGLREELVARMSLTAFVDAARATLETGGDRTTFATRFDRHDVTVLFAPAPGEIAFVDDALAMIERLELDAAIALPHRGLNRGGQTMRCVFAGDLTLLDLPAPTPNAPLQRALKRGFDLAASGAALVLLAPLLIGVTIALKAHYGWRNSVFFSQVRVGKDRRRFRCWKFRTMAPDAEQRLQHVLDTDPEARAEWETHQKLSNDPRITKIGGFLRKSSLDELPQLFNVLRGDMSLVGPRPIVAPEVGGYINDAAYYESPTFELYARARPGVTGLWQVSGRASTAYSERMRLDAWYVRNWSIWLDAVIILKTVRAAVLGSGAS